MLQNLHDNLKGVTAWVLVALISVPFVLFGVDSLFLSGSSVEKAAEVNGEKITRFQVDQAVQIRKQQLLNRFGDIDPALLNDELLRQPVLQDLVRQTVIEQSARDNGMDVAAATAFQLIREIPDYQVDGSFDAQRYEYAIRRMGFTPTAHINEVRNELLRNQFNEGLALSSLVTDGELQQLAALTNEKRSYYYLTVPGDPLAETIALDEEEIRSYYEDHQDNYVAEETVAVEYIDLGLNDFLDQVEVNEQALEAAYQARIATLQASEAKEVAHILFAEDDAELAAKIEAQLNDGADFAELAKTHSIDSGTAQQGGNLGYVSSGDLPQALEEVMATLAVGEVSQPVVTDAGIHLVKLLDSKQTEIPTLASMREELVSTLKQQAARDYFIEAVTEMADSAYNASSLADTAELLGHSLQKSKPFTRTGGEGIAALPAVVTAAFSDDVLTQGYPSDVIEIGEDRALVLRVVEHKPSSTLPLEEVLGEVKTALITEKKNQRLQSLGEQLISRIKAGETLESVAKESGYPWQVSLETKRIGGNVDPEVRGQAFALDIPQGRPTVDGFINSEGDFVVVSLTEVEPGEYSELDASQRESLQASSRMAIAEREVYGLTQLLVDSADVEIK